MLLCIFMMLLQSLTTLRGIEGKDFSFIGSLSQLRVLELGNCLNWTKEVSVYFLWCRFFIYNLYIDSAVKVSLKTLQFCFSVLYTVLVLLVSFGKHTMYKCYMNKSD